MTDAVEELVHFGTHPIAHRFLTHADQEAFRHPVRLGFCHGCGLTQLVDPIPPRELYTDYHSLSAWKFNPHVPQLLGLLETLPDLDRNARVIEVGSNDGSFLAELRGRGFENVLGIDPARDAVAAATKRGVRTLNEYLSPAVARRLAQEFGPFDLVIMRQVVEHISALPELAESMQALTEDGAYVLVEVPDFDFNQRAPDYGAIWEEHVNHFTIATLTRFLAAAHVELLHWDTACFSGQILIGLGRRGSREPVVEAPLSELYGAAFAFRDGWPGFRAELRGWLESERSKGLAVAVYGAGCRSCCLINYTGIGEYLSFAADDQREKQGRFLPGSRLRIVDSAALEEKRVGLCLLAVNAENEDKVIRQHCGFMDGGGKFVSVHPPSPRLPDFWSRLD